MLFKTQHKAAQQDASERTILLRSKVDEAAQEFSLPLLSSCSGFICSLSQCQPPDSTKPLTLAVNYPKTCISRLHRILSCFTPPPQFVAVEWGIPLPVPLWKTSLRGGKIPDAVLDCIEEMIPPVSNISNVSKQSVDLTEISIWCQFLNELEFPFLLDLTFACMACAANQHPLRFFSKG